MDFEGGAFRRARLRVRAEGGERRVETTVEGGYESPRPPAQWAFIGG
jgi:hypothetical protein